MVNLCTGGYLCEKVSLSLSTWETVLSIHNSTSSSGHDQTFERLGGTEQLAGRWGLSSLGHFYRDLDIYPNLCGTAKPMENLWYLWNRDNFITFLVELPTLKGNPHACAHTPFLEQEKHRQFHFLCLPICIKEERIGVIFQT